MTLFITGSESFVGRVLVADCDKLGIPVVGIDSVPNPDQRPNFVVGDIRDPDLVDLIPEKAVVVHLAAVSRDADCQLDPKSAFDVNVGGTLNVLQAARKNDSKQIVFASSEWVYGDVRNDEIQVEDQPIDVSQMTSFYAMTKIVGERILALDDSKMSKTILRFGIIYGPRRSNWSAVESLFNTVSEQPEVLVGCLDTARRFIHVDDIVSGVLNSVGQTGVEIFNISGDRLITLREVVETSAAILRTDVAIVESDPEAVSVRNPDNQKARANLEWAPRVDLRTGLETLADFFAASTDS